MKTCHWAISYDSLRYLSFLLIDAYRKIKLQGRLLSDGKAERCLVTGRRSTISPDPFSLCSPFSIPKHCSGSRGSMFSSTCQLAPPLFLSQPMLFTIGDLFSPWREQSLWVHLAFCQAGSMNSQWRHEGRVTCHMKSGMPLIHLIGKHGKNSVFVRVLNRKVCPLWLRSGASL